MREQEIDQTSYPFLAARVRALEREKLALGGELAEARTTRVTLEQAAQQQSSLAARELRAKVWRVQIDCL